MQNRNTESSQARWNGHQGERSSPDTLSSSSSNKNNAGRPDSGLLANRLKHLDDCIKQVKSMMKSLEKSEDPVVRKQMMRLQQMMQQMKSEDSQLDLHKIRVNTLSQAQPKSQEPEEDSYEAEVSHIPSGGAGDYSYTDQEEEKLAQQNIILKRIMETQEKLSALQDQHSLVTSLQKKAENKLAEARAVHEQISSVHPDLEELSSQLFGTSALGAAHDMVETPETRTRKWNRKQQEMAPPANMSRSPFGDSDGWQLNEMADDEQIKSDLENIQHRINQLKQLGVSPRVTEKVPAQPAGHLEKELSDFTKQRQKLEGKLKDLHDQKSHVDQMLAELAKLQSTVPVVGGGEDATDGSVPVPQALHSGDSTSRPSSKESDHFSNSRSARNKKKKLEEMRDTLRYLKMAIQNLEDDPAPDSQDYADNELPPEPQPYIKGKDKRQGHVLQNKKDNLRVDFPARRHYEAEGRANEDADLPLAVLQKVPVSAGQDDSAALQDKVKRLQATRNHLQKLQGLLSSLQDGSNPALEVPSAQQRLSQDSNTDEEAQAEAEDSNKNPTDEFLLQEGKRQILTLRLLQSQMPTKNEFRSGADGTGILKEKYRSSTSPSEPLCLVPPRRDNLRHLGSREQNHLPRQPNTVSSAKKDNVNSISSTLPKNLYEQVCDTSKSGRYFNQGLEDYSNIHHEELSKSLSLQSKLHREKAILEELLKQEQSKQLSYSRNEDVHSLSGSSIKSEPLDGSGSAFAAGTTVAATWGGSSTQDNFEEEEEHHESIEDRETDGSVSEEETEGLQGERQELEAQDSALPLHRPQRLADNRLASCTSTKVTQSVASGTSLWAGKKNLQNHSLNRNDVQNEEVGVEETAAAAAPVSNMATTWQQFTLHLQQQLEHTNVLCQSILQDQQALTNMLMSSVVSLPSGQTSRPGGTEFLHQYTLQLQQQQQLLLSLTHCYHILGLQQLEINQLQHCFQQASLNDEVMRTCPGNIFPEELHPLMLSSWPWSPAQHSHFNLVPTSQAASPGQQESRNAQGTLNNQVVPGTRANNFWDNFRSYSRQNLLSNTVPSKSNELPANFQVRQSVSCCGVADMAGPRGQQRPRTQDCSPEESVSDDRHHMRPVPNSELQEMLSRSGNKKPNLSKHHTPGPDHLLVPQQIHPGQVPPAANVVVPRLEELARASQEQDPPSSEILKASIQSELSRLLTNNEDAASLMTVLHQLQMLKSQAVMVKSHGGARRKTPLPSKSNVPKDYNRSAESRRNQQVSLSPMHKISSGSSPELHLSVELAENHQKAEGTLSDSTIDQKPGHLTGAVRKKTRKGLSETVPSPRPSSEANVQRASAFERRDSTRDSLTPEDSQFSDIAPEIQVERSMLNLVLFLRQHSTEECTSELLGNICTHLISSLAPSLHSLRHRLVQVLQLCLSKFIGSKVQDKEEAILMEVTELLFKELTFHKLLAARKEKAETEDSSCPPVLGVAKNDVSKPYPEAAGEHTESSTMLRRDIPGAENEPVSAEPRHRSSVNYQPENDYQSIYQPPALLDEDEADPGLETEPEAEPEDTQDLAEADQSPGQVDASVQEPEGEAQMNGLEQAAAVARAAENHHIQQAAGAEGGLEESSLDDIPTKLPATEESQHLESELSSNRAENGAVDGILGDGEAGASTGHLG